MSEPSKRPWKVYKQTVWMFGDCPQARCQIEDAEQRGVFCIEGPKELCEANAKLVLDAVNGREALVGLVRRFMGIINHNAPIASVFALLAAEEEGWSEMKEEEKAAKVSGGYKRLGKLMTEAYALVGEEEKE